MSVIRLTLIVCDACGATYADGDVKTMTAEQQRHEYVADGWQRRNGKDYCEDCNELIEMKWNG